MNKQNDLDVNLYFKGKVDSLRDELINLGTFNPDIKAVGRNLTENFELFAYYSGNIMYINVDRINHDSEILNNIKKATSFSLDEKNTNPSTKKKINKLYDISEKIISLRKFI